MRKSLCFLLIMLIGASSIKGEENAKAVFFKSLVLPYWSMSEMNRQNRKNIYLIADVALFFGYFGSNRYGDWKKDEYQNYAVEHAGIKNAEDKGDSFYKDLKFYDSLRHHDLYAGGEIYGDVDKYYWKWESVKHKLKYRDLRNSSETAYQAGKLFLGGLILNHIIGAIDAVRIYNKQKRLNLTSYTHYNGKSAYVQLSYEF